MLPSLFFFHVSTAFCETSIDDIEDSHYGSETVRLSYTTTSFFKMCTEKNLQLRKDKFVYF